MSVRVGNPLNNPLLGSLGRPLAPNDGARAPGVGGANVPAARPQPARPEGVRPAVPQQPLSSATGALPAEAPQGTDPELWSVLTGEERAFFAKAAQSGPLTYSRISAGVRALQGNPVPQGAPALLGARLDVRG